MTRHVRVWLAVPMILGLVFVTASCGDDDEGEATGATGGTSVDVTLQEFAVLPAQESAPAGDVTFAVTNEGPEDTHEFVVFKTDLAPDALPTASDGSVDEEGEGVELSRRDRGHRGRGHADAHGLARRGQLRPHLQHRRGRGRRDDRPLPAGDADGLHRRVAALQLIGSSKTAGYAVEPSARVSGVPAHIHSRTLAHLRTHTLELP